MAEYMCSGMNLQSFPLNWLAHSHQNNTVGLTPIKSPLLLANKENSDWQPWIPALVDSKQSRKDGNASWHDNRAGLVGIT